MSRSSRIVILAFFPETGTTAPRFPLLKSYFAFILFHLVSHGFTCRNNPNAVFTPCVDHHQYAAKSIPPIGDIALLALPKILYCHSLRIFENREGIGK